MKISELITKLEACLAEYGDRELRTWSPSETHTLKPVSDVVAPVSFNGKDYLVVDSQRNWPSKTEEPSGKGRDNA